MCNQVRYGLRLISKEISTWLCGPDPVNGGRSAGTWEFRRGTKPELLWADSVTVTRKSPKLSFKVQILIGLCAEKLWLMLQSAHGKLCSGGCDSLSPLV